MKKHQSSFEDKEQYKVMWIFSVINLKNVQNSSPISVGLITDTANRPANWEHNRHYINDEFISYSGDYASHNIFLGLL